MEGYMLGPHLLRPRGLIIALSIIGTLTAGSMARAAGPRVMNHQGVLRNLAGDPVNGEFTLRFRMFKSQMHFLPL